MNKDDVVTITAREGQPVIVVSDDNPLLGYIRAIQKRIITKNGWLRPKILTALIPGAVEDLKALDWKAGQEIVGKIVVREQLEPFNTKNPDRDIKISRKTGIVCVCDGQPIYRKTIFSFDPEAKDEFIEHTNSDEIKAAYAALKKQPVPQAQPE
jgi:hypothetical protein